VLLWEALAGRHPFWKVSPLETGRQIQAGAPSLGEVRPDLPAPLLKAVDKALSVDPERRPTAAALAEGLRGVFRERARRARVRPPVNVDLRRALRVGPPALAALAAGWVATALPFYPARWPLLLAVVAAALTAWKTRLGLAFTLAVPVFPLGNFSLGLALVYGGLAVLWLVLAWREPETGLLIVLGPLLAPFGAVALLPLLLQRVAGGLRRAAYALGAVLVAAVVAGIRGLELPLTGVDAPKTLGLAAEERPGVVVDTLWSTLDAHPALLLTGLVLAGAAVLAPICLRGGELWIAVFGASLAAAVLLTAPDVSPWPLVACAWVTWAVLTLQWRLSGGEPARIPTFDTVPHTMRALLTGRLKPGGGLGWPQRAALARRR
jgi:hypothetical protein